MPIGVALRARRVRGCALAVAVAASVLAAGRAAGDAYEHFPHAPVHVVTWFPRQDVNVYVSPHRPHAGEEVMFSFEIADRVTKEPLSGPLTVSLYRDGLFGHVTTVAAQDLQHDAGFPGEYTLRAVPPTSGLYMLRIESRTEGAGADATIGLGIWPAGLNRWAGVPLAVVVGLFAYAIVRTKRAASRMA